MTRLSVPVRRLLLTAALALPFALFACPLPEGGDDDDAGGADDDDATGADDDDFTAAPVELCGDIISVDRATGALLSDAEYAARSGRIVLYITTDPTDLSAPIAKMTLDGPEPWCLDVGANSGSFWVLAIADWDRNSIIGGGDTMREYAENPVHIGFDDIADLDVTLDIATHGGGGGGGGGGGARTTVSGITQLINIDDGPIAVTSNTVTYQGPNTWTHQTEAGAYSIGVRDSLGRATLLGYRDKDENGLFEPDDWIGEATSNPITVGTGDVEGVTILIPSIEPINAPLPPSYVTIDGDVSYSSYSEGDIIVTASAMSPAGQVFARVVMASPGTFTLRVPPFVNDLVVWAALDADMDGLVNLMLDPSDVEPPIEFVSGDISGVSMQLQDAGSSISGQVLFTGATTGADILYIALHDNPSYTGNAVAVDYVPAPSFPVSFWFEDLDNGTYYPSAYLDIGGDSPPDTPGAEDYSGTYPTGIELTGGTVVTGVDFGVVN